MQEFYKIALLAWFIGTIFVITLAGLDWLKNKVSQTEQPCILPRNDAQMLGGYEKI